MIKTNSSQSVCHVLFVGTLLFMSVTPCAPASAREQAAVEKGTDAVAITRDVHEIAAPGVPGPLVLFGANAFPIVVGRESKDIVMPVVAGTTLGNGRIVAFGHGGYLEAAAMKTLDTGKLIVNAIRWAAGKESPRILVAGNEGLAKELSSRGLNARDLKGEWEKDLPWTDVLIVQTHGLSAAQQQAVIQFVKNGGGLLAGGLGWGWLQLNPSRYIREHPGNQLLREAGIAWGDGTLDRTTKGGYAAGGEPPRGLNAVEALAVIERAATNAESQDEKPLLAQSAATVSAAVRVIPLEDPIVKRCRTLLESRRETLVPTKEKPIRAADAVARALMAVQVEVMKEVFPPSPMMHPASATFPGVVPKDAPRITLKSFKLHNAAPGWTSTGLYAPAGNTVRASSTRVGTKVRIGCHTDRLWKLDSWQRVPEISSEVPLELEDRMLISPFGGLIYIEASNEDVDARVSFSGAVEAPRFILGKTTPEEWKKSREAPAPWGELETSKIIITVPSSHLRTLDDPESLMKFWDKIADAHATLAARPLERKRPERYVADVQISAGYMHSGYPIMTHLDAAEAMTSLDKLKSGSWGLVHELGHNHQESDWTFEGTTEVTCNLFALHAIDTICTPPPGTRGHGAVDKPPSLEKYLAGGAKFEQWKKDPFLALQMYVQLQREFGWETFKKVFAEYRALPKSERPKNDDEKRDQWMVRFSRTCGRNLGPFFVAWGVPTSEGARQSIAEMPEWMPGDWPGK